jgi:hypothetical protein
VRNEQKARGAVDLSKEEALTAHNSEERAFTSAVNNQDSYLSTFVEGESHVVKERLAR